MRRMTRLTNAFSKKWETLWYAYWYTPTACGSRSTTSAGFTKPFASPRR
jgi:hypothetical protein